MSTASPTLVESSKAADVLGQIEDVLTAAGYKLTGGLDGATGTAKSQGQMLAMTLASMEPRSGGQSVGRENILMVVELSMATSRGLATGVQHLKKLVGRLQGITAMLLNDTRISDAYHREFRGTRFDNEPNKTTARLQIGFLIQEKYQ